MITVAPAALLVGWWLGQVIELGLAVAVLASAAAGTPLRRLCLRLGGAVVACILLTVALQALGLAPAMRVARWKESGDRIATPSDRIPGKMAVCCAVSHFPLRPRGSPTEPAGSDDLP